ncbi:hypothetical protein [Georgenia sp. SUBG003]|uniref:hypothetical protein n=1 Tax=Georgenia sp. SUBG003 TaxID=1497974 RepID=UPI003AB7CE6F
MTRPAAVPTASAVNTMTIQCVFSAIVCVASVDAHTVARPMTDPTERSIPPAVMTKVTPMLMTPRTAVCSRITMMLLRPTNRGPEVTMPMTTSRTRAMMRPRL